MRVKDLAQEHNTMTWPGFEPTPLDPESSTLTTRPPRLPLAEMGVINVADKVCIFRRFVVFATCLNVDVH